MTAMGEGALGSNYRMVADGHDIEFLVQSTQIPGFKREAVDGKGPRGVSFKQQGNLLNADDITISFKEVIAGTAYAFIKRCIREKLYLTWTLSLVSESNPEGNAATTFSLYDAWLELDATDLSNDDGTQFVKPSGTIHYQWHSGLDESDEEVQGMEG
jgi:hypothetical protein